MLGLLLIIALGIWIILYTRSLDSVSNDFSARLSGRLDRLWDVAHSSIKERKYLRAEKALLTILRVDERNSTAYNRLGILYAKQKAYDDAIECFEIAQSLDPNASSLHNVGLIYYETGRFDKASLAFEQALELEGDVPARYIAYAKVQEKLGHDRRMIEALEKAVELEPNPQALSILADAYDRGGQTELADKLRKKLAKISGQSNLGVTKSVRQPRKVVM